MLGNAILFDQSSTITVKHCLLVFSFPGGALGFFSHVFSCSFPHDEKSNRDQYIKLKFTHREQPEQWLLPLHSSLYGAFN